MTRFFIKIIILTILVKCIEITDITDGWTTDSLIMDEFWDRSSLQHDLGAESSVIRLTESKYREQIVADDGTFLADRPWYILFAHLENDNSR